MKKKLMILIVFAMVGFGILETNIDNVCVVAGDEDVPIYIGD